MIEPAPAFVLIVCVAGDKQRAIARRRREKTCVRVVATALHSGKAKDAKDDPL